MFHKKSLNAAMIAGALGVVLMFGAFVAQQQAQGPAPAQPDTPTPAVLQNYKPVTAERLKKPEDGDWLMVRRTYDGWGYSPLEQITAKNVDKLQPVWSFSTGVVSGHEAPPMVNNGVMFVATPSNQVIAIDPDGKLLWRFRGPRPKAQTFRTSDRGVPYMGVFLPGEAVLVAIDVKTGKEVWAIREENKNTATLRTMAPSSPMKILVGASGGGGIRGFSRF
jgi:alcohol dehydrogenase (cytochrome c)